MSKHDLLGYYASLGLKPTATMAEIKLAYRRLAKELHPDLSPHSDAARFHSVVQAYSVLSNPERRSVYNDRAKADEKKKASRPQPPQRLKPICCWACGHVTVQPRYLRFHRVSSFLVVTRRRPIEGMFCSSCARKEALKASAASALIGWWAIPLGPFVTVAEVMRNASGGSRIRVNEEQATIHNARAFAQQGKHQLAYALAHPLRDSRNIQISSAARKLIQGIQDQQAISTVPQFKNVWKARPHYMAAHAVMLSAVPLLLALLLTASAPGFAALSWMLPQERQAFVTPAAEGPVQMAEAGEIDDVTGLVADDNLRSGTCPLPVMSGDILDGYLAGAREGHQMELRNGSATNAIVKIRDADSGILAAAILLTPGTKTTLYDLPDGEYRVQYALGDELGYDCRSFVQIRAAAEFPKTKSLRIRHEADANGLWVRTERLSHTARSQGEGLAKAISEAAFRR